MSAGPADNAAPPLPNDRELDQLMHDRAALAARLRQLVEANARLAREAAEATARQDRSERQAADQARAQVDAAQKRQVEFLAMLAHELRNPLAPLSMTAELLGRHAADNPDVARLQGILNRQVLTLSRMLDDLLDATRLSSGKIELAWAQVSLSDVIDSAVETCEATCTQHHQTLERVACPADVFLDGDPIRLAQVFANLLLNASAFSPDGSTIRLVCRVLPAQVEVSIEDEGVGIAAELLPHVFDLFFQGPRPPGRREGGLGVGLSVVRSLVQLHRGTVRAESAGPGKGARFTVSLPRDTLLAPTAAPDIPDVAAGRLRILLIEDNVDAGETLREFLSLSGHAVSFATTGAEGLRRAQDAPVDLMVCDIGLPDMAGYEVVSALRQACAAAHRPMPYAVALTGYGAAEDARRAHEAGFDEYLVKPVDGPALLALIARVPPPDKAGRAS